jgi:hypothetical protein
MTETCGVMDQVAPWADAILPQILAYFQMWSLLIDSHIDFQIYCETIMSNMFGLFVLLTF